MLHSNFVHLHVHTYYSLLDGAIPIDELARKAREFKLPAVAITDHGNLFGAVEFYQRMVQEGIKPIIGCELYLLTKGSRKDRDVRRKEGDFLSHLVVLVKNHKGYQNLCRLITSSYLEGFYYKPRIDKDILKECNEGLIALSGCLKGEVPGLLASGNFEAAKKAAEELALIFGDGRFYLELMNQGLPGQDLVAEGLKRLSKEMGIKLVATNDAHYVVKEHYHAHDVLLCIQTGKTVSQEDRLKFGSDQFYLKSPQEMMELFKDTPEAIENTKEVAALCNFEFDFKSYHFPRFALPDGKDAGSELVERAMKGFEERWPVIESAAKGNKEKLKEKYIKRLMEELDMIKKMGFAGYFLIVADFINYAKRKGISVGPGRGSAAGSLVAYSLRITDLDPIPYGLLFERFLNPERISMPDMDIDFCMRRRGEVIEYVNNLYGNVSQIITFGKMKARAVVRDVARVMGFTYGDADKIAKLIPNAPNITLDKALQVEPRLKELEENDPKVKELLNIARVLEGFPRHASTHAAGVVISDQPLVNFLPLYLGQNNEIVTQFDMKAVEKIGLIKFDFLGLKTLSVIEDTVKTVKERRGEEIVIERIPLDDKKVFENLASGDTAGVFQLESRGMSDLVMKLKPTSFEDIIALVALFRPGPLGSGMVDDFINRKHGRVSIEYPLKELEPILKDTYGVIVYQEQVMQIANKLAGFTLGDADILRRAMGKKRADEMARQREKFVMGCVKNKIPREKAEYIFDLMAKFAEYGFNRAHSAAYALLAYQTAYLKAHYATEYMAALLTSEMGNTDKVLEYMNDCKEHGITILPPDINESGSFFSVVGDGVIRFGLAAVKNVGIAAIESIVEERSKNGVFKSIFEFCERVDGRKVNKRVLESLIKCGAFDFTKVERSSLMAALDKAMERASLRQRDRHTGQASMFDIIPREQSGLGGEDYPSVPPWSEHQKLAFEKESLGFYITGHPLAQYETILKQYATTSACAVSDLPDKSEVKIGGMVVNLREITTKRGDRMGFVKLEDLSGSVDVIVFSDVYRQVSHIIKGERPVFVVGTVDADGENVKVIAKELIPISEVPERLTKSIHFRLSAAEVNSKQLQQLKNILSHFSGNCPAYIHLMIPEKSETILMLPKELKLKPSTQLALTVEKIFGHNVTYFKS